MNLLEATQGAGEKKHKTVVRLSTEYWYDNKGAYMRKALRVLKRKSFGYDLLHEECGMSGAETISRILNFNSAKDGVYELIVCNISTDYESGMVDDWDLKLIPFDEIVTPEQVLSERKL